MARGQRQAADQQRALTNQYAADAYQRGEGIYSGLLPGYQDLASGKGYSDAEKAATTNATMGGLGLQARAAGRGGFGIGFGPGGLSFGYRG